MDATGLYADTDGRGPAISLTDGSRFYILEPDPAAIQPRVIAHALSQLCRFTGHTQRFYSVAQHCVLVSRIVSPELAMQGLMHDASEAFIGDISRPFKAILDGLAPGLVRGIEERIHEAIAERFGFPYPHDPAVKAADNVVGATEIRDVMAPSPGRRVGMPEPLPGRIDPMPAHGAYRWFLYRFLQVGGELNGYRATHSDPW